jgi:hypothetical protein
VIGRTAALLIAAAVLAGCGGHQDEVFGASVLSWPHGKRLEAGPDVPWSLVKLPSRAPRPLAQGTCRSGTVVELVVARHHRMRKIRYGPCRLPASIEELARSTRAGYASLQRPIPGVPSWAVRPVRRQAANMNDPEPDGVTLRRGGAGMEVPGRTLETFTIRGHFSCRNCGVGLNPYGGEIRCTTLTLTADARTHQFVGGGRDGCRKG